MGWREELELDHIERDIHGVFRLLERVLDNQEQIMGVLDDLRANDATLDTELGQLSTETASAVTEIGTLQGQITDLQNQLASGVAPADLQPIVDNLASQAGTVGNAVQALHDALNPAPAPAPAPPADQPPAEQPPAVTPPADQPPTEQPAT